MAQEIGTVAFAAGDTGGLQTDDRVELNQVIKTGEDGMIAIELDNGTRFDLGRNSEAVLDAEVYQVTDLEALRVQSVAEAELMQDELLAALETGSEEDILQAINEGEATAAGGPPGAGAGDDGTGDSSDLPVTIDRTGEVGNITAGFDTAIAEEQTFQETEEVVGDVEPEPADPIVETIREFKQEVDTVVDEQPEFVVSDASIDSVAENDGVTATTTTRTIDYNQITTTTVTTEDFYRDITTTTFPDGSVTVDTGEWTLDDSNVDESAVETPRQEVFKTIVEEWIESDIRTVPLDPTTSEPLYGEEVLVSTSDETQYSNSSTTVNGVTTDTTVYTKSNYYETPGTETTTDWAQDDLYTRSATQTTFIDSDGTVTVSPVVYTEWEYLESNDPYQTDVVIEPVDSIPRTEDLFRTDIVETYVETDPRVVVLPSETADPVYGQEQYVGTTPEVQASQNVSTEDGVTTTTTVYNKTDQYETPGTETTTDYSRTDTYSRTATTVTNIDYEGVETVTGPTYTEWALTDTGTPYETGSTEDDVDPIPRDDLLTKIVEVQEWTETNEYTTDLAPVVGGKVYGTEYIADGPTDGPKTTTYEYYDDAQVFVKSSTTTWTTTTNYETPWTVDTTYYARDDVDTRDGTTTTVTEYDGTVSGPYTVYTPWDTTEGTKYSTGSEETDSGVDPRVVEVPNSETYTPTLDEMSDQAPPLMPLEFGKVTGLSSTNIVVEFAITVGGVYVTTGIVSFDASANSGARTFEWSFEDRTDPDNPVPTTEFELINGTQYDVVFTSPEGQNAIIHNPILFGNVMDGDPNIINVDGPEQDPEWSYTDFFVHTGESGTVDVSGGSYIIDTSKSGNGDLVGTADGDILMGLDGDDDIAGGAGNDILVGGDGTDLLIGGADNDIIFGGEGDDTMTGGTGVDTFIVREGDIGSDIITDFTLGEDKLHIGDLLDGATADNIEQYLNPSFNGDGDLVLSVDPTGSGSFGSYEVTLQGITAADVTGQYLVDLVNNLNDGII